MSNEDILIWLMHLGRDWQEPFNVVRAFKYKSEKGFGYVAEHIREWRLTESITHNAEGQYKLTKKAINSLSTSLDKSA